MPVAVVTDDEVRRVDELLRRPAAQGEAVGGLPRPALPAQDRITLRVRPKTDPHLLLVLRRLVGDRSGVAPDRVERTAGV